MSNNIKNRLTLIKELKEKSADGHKMGLFKCSCGRTAKIIISRVKNGYTKSCGCLIEEARSTHGGYKNGHHPLLITYKNMLGRCRNPNDQEYHNYGGRGISVCERWLGKFGFLAFVADVGPKPSANHSLDRWPNKDGNYEPTNVRWATPKQQANNNNSNVLITHNGETLTISEWADRIGVKYDTLRCRIQYYGMPIEKALTKKIRKWTRRD